MRSPLNWRIVLAASLTSSWCAWFLIGWLGDVIPAAGIRELKTLPTENCPDGHQVFPAYDLLSPAVTTCIVVTAALLITLQVIAILRRSQVAASVAGAILFYLGLPVIFHLITFRRFDPAHDLLWDTCLPIAMLGTFLLGGLSMVDWAVRLYRESTNATETLA